MFAKRFSVFAHAVMLPLTITASGAQEPGSRDAVVYVVEVRAEDNPRRVADDVAAATGGAVRHVYTTVLHGFAIAVPAGTTARDLLADPRIIKVERDGPVSIPRPVEGR